MTNKMEWEKKRVVVKFRLLPPENRPQPFSMSKNPKRKDYFGQAAKNLRLFRHECVCVSPLRPLASSFVERQLCICFGHRRRVGQGSECVVIIPLSTKIRRHRAGQGQRRISGGFSARKNVVGRPEIGRNSANSCRK